MRILITGGAGFIGSHLVRHYQGKADILVLDSLRTGRLENLAGLAHEFIGGSVTDKELVRRVMAGVDMVFHLAAMVSVPESMYKPSECVGINVLGLLNVLDEAAMAGVKKLVFASSAAVYGDNPMVPKTEGMLPEPKSPYAITKLDGEYYLDLYRREKGLESVSLRLFNVFGPRQDPSSAYAAAVPIFLHKALAGEPIHIFGDGGQTRDFVHVTDVVEAMAFAASSPGMNGVFNVGYGGSVSIGGLVARILGMTGSRSEVRNFAEREGDVRHSRADISKLLASGFRHVSSLDAGLAECLEHLAKAPRTPHGT